MFAEGGGGGVLAVVPEARRPRLHLALAAAALLPLPQLLLLMLPAGHGDGGVATFAAALAAIVVVLPGGAAKEVAGKAAAAAVGWRRGVQLVLRLKLGGRAAHGGGNGWMGREELMCGLPRGGDKVERRGRRGINSGGCMHGGRRRWRERRSDGLIQSCFPYPLR